MIWGFMRILKAVLMFDVLEKNVTKLLPDNKSNLRLDASNTILFTITQGLVKIIMCWYWMVEVKNCAKYRDLKEQLSPLLHISHSERQWTQLCAQRAPNPERWAGSNNFFGWGDCCIFVSKLSCLNQPFYGFYLIFIYFTSVLKKNIKLSQ